MLQVSGSRGILRSDTDRISLRPIIAMSSNRCLMLTRKSVARSPDSIALGKPLKRTMNFRTCLPRFTVVSSISISEHINSSVDEVRRHSDYKKTPIVKAHPSMAYSIFLLVERLWQPVLWNPRIVENAERFFG